MIAVAFLSLEAVTGVFAIPLTSSLSMKKIYHLATCTTNQRILKELKPGKDVVLQEIKTEPMTAAQVDEMAKLAGSYEAIFSRKAMKYRSMGLDKMELKEKDYRKYLIQEYTFLKRPVIIVGKELFAGSAKATVEAAQKALTGIKN